jgi:hypothetical protein
VVITAAAAAAETIAATAATNFCEPPVTFISQNW